MARVLKMPEKRKVYYCPMCGTPKIEFESEQHIAPNLVTFRYRCEDGHVSITSIEVPARRAVSGDR